MVVVISVVGWGFVSCWERWWMVRRALSLEDRVVIAEGVGRGLTDREIGLLIGRDHTVVA